MRIDAALQLCAAALCVATAGFLSGCAGSQRVQAAAMTGGDPAVGPARITHYGCGSCHTIPGVSGANARVGPSLAGLGNQQYIAGHLSNSPDNLVRWIRHPHQVNEKTIMPELGVNERDATDIAAYLYSLK